MDIHLLINIFIAGIGVCLWLGNRKKRAKMDEKWSYQELLHKLKTIIDSSEYDIFKIAAKEKGHADYKVDEDFKKYLDSNARKIPVYVQQFLEDGRKQIMETKVSRWIL